MKTKHVLLSILTAVLFTANSQAQTVPSYVPTNGLVGWWPFNGNAIDESINTNDGAVSGATLTTDRFGNANKAYSFDGVNDFIDLTLASFNINGNSNRTISCWAFFSNTFSDYRLISIGTPSNSNSFNMVVNSGGHLGFMGFNQDFYPINGQLLNNNNWYNLVLVYENNIIRIYINGVLDNTSGNIILNTLGNNNFFGKSNHSQYPSFLNGKLDDIGIWNRALTQQEITNLYNGTSVGLNEFNNSKLFSVYPNPAKHQINIKADASLINSVYTIYDYTGKLILSGKLTSENTSIELTNLAQGIYMLTIGDNNKQTFKLVRD